MYQWADLRPEKLSKLLETLKRLPAKTALLNYVMTFFSYFQVIAVELLAACQAIEFLRPLKTTVPLEEVIKVVRSVVRYVNTYPKSFLLGTIFYPLLKVPACFVSA